jgi:hypothetical protein
MRDHRGEAGLKLDRYDLSGMMQCREYQRHHATAGAELQNPCALARTCEAREQYGIDREPIAAGRLDDSKRAA